MFRLLNTADLNNRVIAVRVDLNVPIVSNNVSDNTRIKEIKQTFDYIASCNPKKIILLSHFGRPKNHFDSQYSLAQIIPELASVLNVNFTIFPNISEVKLSEHKYAILENLRFFNGEEENDLSFSKELSEMCDVYVNDAFSCSHRKHASIFGISHYKPIYMGLLLQKEVEVLNNICYDFKGKMGAIVGGSKVSTKIDVLLNLAKRCKFLAVCGGMANTFLYAMGYEIGRSIYEPDLKEKALEIINIASQHSCDIIIPEDVITCSKIVDGATSYVRNIKSILKSDVIADIGPRSIAKISELSLQTDMIIWNGPLGAFETKPFNVGTESMARYIALQTSEGKLTSIIGGGDVVSAVISSGLRDSFSYISTGGGAFLEYIEGKELPGISAVTINNS